MPTQTTSRSGDPAALTAAVLDAAQSPTAILPHLDRCDAAAVVFADYVAASNVTVRIDDNLRIGRTRSAYYRPAEDLIALPPFGMIREVAQHHWTAFHEAAHSTGHATRLARDLTRGLGTKAHAREELTAVVAASIVCTALGLRAETEAVHENQLQIQLRQLTDFDVTENIDAAWPAAKLMLGAHAPAWSEVTVQLQPTSPTRDA